MGAFHKGHLDLMRAAKAECGKCVVSLFVNPTQFGPNEDLSRYPRQEAQDFGMAADAGADLIFAPSVDAMYQGSLTRVVVEEVSSLWEGAQRPGHFAGVALVVLKLLNLVRPTRAYFGLKDLQQCAVVRQMVQDLFVQTELRFIETVREPSGLAMSSRNAYLTAENRALAGEFANTLFEASGKIVAGSEAGIVLGEAAARLQSFGFGLDYCCLVDARTMQELQSPNEHSRIMAAIRLQGIRLLDNVPCSIPF